ncbi:hypothetical protein [Allomuricauda sp. M10]|uniref:hypothetical protein n=1 Tax=Allomuricauda sp. M10 TaxID=2683292 RepID=UPI001D194491|nr:hypothetical protein [Muricauda sp. M10]
MVTFISLLIFISFYLFYGTSKKMVVIHSFGMEKWIGEHASTSKFIGSALMIISLGLSCYQWGWGSGVFTFSIILMTLANLVILLAPLQLLNYRTSFIAFTLSLIFELFLF